MGRSPCCDENGLKKGPWTPEEDQKLLHYIHKHGHGSWRALPKLAGLNRCGKSCRLRWTNYLRPDIKRGKFSQEEEQTILHLHSILGNKWSAIASHLPGRTDNEIKNFWNTHLKKKLIQMGFDPMTHQPIIRTDNIVSTLPYLLALANNITLPHHQSLDEHYFKSQAEALELANLQCLHYLLQSTTTTNSTNITNLHQEAFNFLTSFSNNNVNEIEKPVINCPQLDSVSIFSNNGMETAISQPLHHPNTSPHNITHPPLVSFSASHSCLNTDNNIQQASNFNNNNGELEDHIVNESSWIIPSPLTLTGTSPDSSTSTSSSHAGVTSSSSYWPELFFEDPFMPHLS